MGEKSPQQRGVTIDPILEEIPRPLLLPKIEQRGRIETLTRRLEIPIFEGLESRGLNFLCRVILFNTPYVGAGEGDCCNY